MSNPLELWVNKNPDKFNELLPPDLDGGKERFLRNALFQIGANENLRGCTPVSLIEACLRATVLGLDIGVLGQAYIVPYNTKKGKIATMIPGYRGLLSLARRSNKLKAVHAEVVCKNDTYERTARRFEHSWDPFADRGEAIGAYAIFQLSNGFEQVETMSRGEIQAIQGRSRAGQNGPWITDPGEMWKKTVIRRGVKKLDLQVDQLNQAIQADNEQYDDSGEITVKKKDGGAQALAAVLGGLPAPSDPPKDSDDPAPSEGPSDESARSPDRSPTVSASPPRLWDWPKTLTGLKGLARSLDVPVWTKITDARTKLCMARAKAEGWEPKDFAMEVQEVLFKTPSSYMEGWPAANRTLDVLIRVPLKGNPDHFQRISELVADLEPEVSPDEAAAAELFAE